MYGFNWLSIEKVKPKCSRDPDALGVPVLIWPRKTHEYGVAYYGRRATGKPAFYLYGAEISGVTHWMPLPLGPSDGL
jgi:hypothetical protein